MSNRLFQLHYLGLMPLLLGVAIAANVSADIFTEPAAECFASVDGFCNQIGNKTCFEQGGGTCARCAGGGPLGDTTCIPVLGGGLCTGPSDVYCGIRYEYGDCTPGDGCVGGTMTGACASVVQGCTP